MLKKIGFSSAALLAMLTCIQPAALFAEGRDDARHSNGYAEQRTARDQNDYRERAETLRRDRDDRYRDRNWTQYRDHDDWYRYNSFRR